MAKLTASGAVNTKLLAELAQVKDGTGGVTGETPASIDYQFGDTEIGFKGDFLLEDEELKSGPIDSIGASKAEQELFQIEGADIPIEDLWADAQDGVLDDAPAAIFDGDDEITGSDEADVLFGWGGNDIIDGGGGADEIAGGKGADELTGGLGPDVFVFLKPSDSKTKAGARDTILDFDRAEGDTIDLSAIDARKGGGDNRFSFVKKAEFGGDKGELRFEAKKGGALVEGDTNGDGKADFALFVSGLSKLRADDFDL
jgi:Ca2+-binding RTX toxin-like protein